MCTQKINFPVQEVLCLLPTERSDLVQVISESRLDDGYPAIVLIGGGIDELHASATQRAIKTIAGIANAMNAVGHLQRN